MRWRTLVLTGALALPGRAAAQQNVANTVHNLSVAGPGSILADTESRVCVFCHTTHAANTEQTPLWNRSLSGQPYTPYDSPSIQALVGQPNGSSKLCLSCHDGTIALGQVLNLNGSPTTISLRGTPDGRMLPGPTRIGTDLLNDHPVSFTYDAALMADDQELVSPATLIGEVKLYPGPTTAPDAVQCATCHDPHTDARPKFLRKDPTGRADNLCMTCHVKGGWSGSTHESATSTFWPSGQTDTTVADQSCIACHVPHTSDGAERLLQNAAVAGESAIEEACYRCHQSSTSGGVALNIQDEFNKTYEHPVTLNPGGHKPVFIPRPGLGLPENVLLTPGSPAENPGFSDIDHVECVDCHNPHKVTASNRTEGMRGISIDGFEVANVMNDPAPTDGQPSDRQYPACFRCHGDTYAGVIGNPTASGVTPSNKRTEFQTTNSAFHPVAGPGRNPSSNLNQQLTGAGLSTNSVIKCTDCHNSDAYENTTGRAPSTGSAPDSPVGPHGSTYPSILRANFWSTLPGPTNWNASNFDLCFRCHNVNQLMGGSTNFDDQIDGKDNLHQVHLDDRSDKARAICKSCHYNIHSNVEAPNTQYRIDGIVYNTPPDGIPTRLVSFHPNIVGIGGRPKPEWWFNTTTRERRCYLECHGTNGSVGGGEVMNGLPYRPSSGDIP